MNHLRAGVDFHPENEGVPPMNDVQSADWEQARLEMLTTPRNRLVLADEQPGTRLRMNTLEGIVEFTLKPWGEQQEIAPESFVRAEVHTSASGAMRFDEVAILGATEGTLIDHRGTIDQFADLAVRPIFRRALYQAEHDLPEDEQRRRVAEGLFVQSQVGRMAIGQGVTQIVPGVVSLVRLTPQKGKQPEIVFDMHS